MTNTNRTNGLITGLIAVAALGASSMANAVVTANYVGAACPGTCTDLATSGYTVSGGAVIAPAINYPNEAKIPGTDTGNQGSVESYNVTSSIPEPLGTANIDITVTGLSNAFSLYWGSIDSYNYIDFFLGGVLEDTFSGTDAKNLIDPTINPSNFNVDGYFRFSGLFDEVVLRSENDDTGSGVAFEVARVPEPGTLALLGLGLAGLGAARRRKSA